ncbi:hypothetical protein DIPPA_08438 [Diplonema papillatum]|nr:hypothetical protein DIPPA_08438 [Diplonema papillatum]
MAGDAQKIEVLKKAVFRLQSTVKSLTEENEQLRRREQASVAASDEAAKSLREMKEEADFQKYNADTLKKKLAALEEKKQAAGPAWRLFQQGSGKEREEREVLEEDLTHRINENEQLHSKLFDLRNELKRVQEQKATMEGMYGQETTAVVSQLSTATEELRIAKSEETRLTQTLRERTEELSALQGQHQALIQRVRDFEVQRDTFTRIGRISTLSDVHRVPQWDDLTLTITDKATSEAAAGAYQQAHTTLASLTRDVEALFSNATERTHILLSRATASALPVKTAALHLLKDALRKANASHQATAGALVSLTQQLAQCTKQTAEVYAVVPGGESASGADAQSHRAKQAQFRGIDSDPAGRRSPTPPSAKKRDADQQKKNALPPVRPDPVNDSLAWAKVVADNMQPVLLAIFAHSPTVPEDQEELQADFVTSLCSDLRKPLEQLIAVVQMDPSSPDEPTTSFRTSTSSDNLTGSRVHASSTGHPNLTHVLRSLKRSLKDLTENVSSLFASEVKVSWELAGLDGANKRIVAGLNGVYNRLVTLAECRATLEKCNMPGTRRAALDTIIQTQQTLSILPPKSLLSDEDMKSLPPSYLDERPLYADLSLAKARLHERAAQRISKCISAAGARVASNRAAPAASSTQHATHTPSSRGAPTSSSDANSPRHNGGHPHVNAATPAGGVASAEQLEELAKYCALFEQNSTPEEEPTVTRQVASYKQAVRTADAKAVEYRIEWQRALFDLEARAQRVKKLEEDNRDLHRRLKNRDIEVKNMSHGYTDQMKVFQDRILDLENRLAAVSQQRR